MNKGNRLVLVYAIVIVLVLAAFIGCSSAPATTPAQPPAATTGATATPKPPTSASPTSTAPAQVLTIRFSHTFAATNVSPPHIFSVKFKELCDQLFPGRVKFEEYPGAQLYTSSDANKAVMSGAIEMTTNTPPYLAPQVPNVDILTLPGYGKSPAHLQDFFLNYGEEFSKRYLYDKLNIGITALHPTDAIVYWFKKPFANLADIKGRRMGQTPGAISKALAEGMGMSVIVNDLSERISAMQTGVIDGVGDTSITTVFKNGIHKYAPYATEPAMTAHYSEYLLYYSYNWYKNLPADFKEKLLSTIWPQSIDAAYKLQADLAKTSMDTVQKEGLTFVTLPPAERAKVINEVYPAVAKQFLSSFNQWELDTWAKVGEKYERGLSFELKK